MKSIGENISAVRKSAGITQEKLAEAMLVTPQAVSKWETDTACPDIDTINRMARFFGVTVDHLINGNDEHPSLKEAAPEEVGKRICVINTKKDGCNVKLKIPVEAIRMLHNTKIVKNRDDDSNNNSLMINMEELLSLAGNGIVGSIADIDANGCNIQISVEEYDY